MIDNELLLRGGSKLEITRALIEKGYPIPVSAWKYYGDELGVLKSDFHSMKKPVIVRGSHPNDYHGYIDVLPTIHDMVDWEGIEMAVRKIEEEASSSRVRIHCDDWNQPYSPEVHILMQEQSDGLIGTMMEHPHTGDITIQYWDKKGRDDGQIVTWATFEDENLYNPGPAFSNYRGATDEELLELIDMYKSINSSGVVDGSYVQQMEFGIDPLFFFQARPFKIREVADFQLPVHTGPCIFSNIVFGITPEDGIEIEMDAMWEADVRYSDELGGESPYGLICTGGLAGSPITMQQIGNLELFVSGAHFNQYLSHAEYRFLKRAKYSMVDFVARRFDYDDVNLNNLVLRGLEPFGRSRFYSNGKQGILIPL